MYCYVIDNFGSLQERHAEYKNVRDIIISEKYDVTVIRSFANVVRSKKIPSHTKGKKKKTSSNMEDL